MYDTLGLEKAEVHHPITNAPIGVIVIGRSFNRPYSVNAEIFIRRGSHTARASTHEVRQIDRRLLINFARPVDESQVEQLEHLLGVEIDEIIDVPGQLVEVLWLQSVRNEIRDWAVQP